MSTITAPANTAVDPLSDPIAWVWGKIVYAVSLAVVALVLGGALYYTWDSLAGAFSFTRPLGGFWNCTLVVLGAYTASVVYNAARSGATADVLSGKSRAEALDYAGKALVLLLLGLLATHLA